MHEHAPRIGPLQHEELEIGGEARVRCLTTCRWLGEHARERFALLLSPSTAYGRSNGLHVEIARMPGSKGDLSRTLIDEIEKIIALAQSYRGKVISLEKLDDWCRPMAARSSSSRISKPRSMRCCSRAAA
jgi:hypothetical protein